MSEQDWLPAAVRTAGIERSLKAGQSLFRQGSRTVGLYEVISGKVRLARVDRSGRGSIMVAVMGVMFVVHRWYGGKHKPQDALEILRQRFARGEISREEYEERRKVLNA